MAEIYLSKKLAAEGVQKFVAVKRILSQHNGSEDFIRMFKDEAKIAVNLSSSNVVSIYDFGVENNQLYLVMEYVEGKNLRQILNRLKQNNKRFSISHNAFITKQIAAGLDHAHRLIDATTGEHLNIIHRDMSPQNVMVSFEGEVKIIDFGIAKSTTQEESTRVGTLKGKFGYMSPEQVDGLEVDLRTDIFALGIMLWEMLSEQRLFLTNNEMTTLRKIRDCKVPSLREIDPNVPVELEKIVNKALARSKTQRYQTAAELQKDLQSFLNRYNPDFSNQDFSEFIKDLYSDEIVEARKRQVAYSKVEMPHMNEQQHQSGQQQKFNQRESLTQSVTYSKGESEKMNFVDLELKKVGEFSLPTDGSQPNLTLSQQGKNPISTATTPKHPSPSPSAFRTPEMTKSYGGGSSTGIRVPTPHESSGSSPLLGILFVVMAGVVGVFALLNETQPRLVAHQCAMVKKYVSIMNCYETSNATRQTSSSPKLKITSDPSGAAIFINSQPTGLKTPGEIEMDSAKPFSISLSLGGYRSETQKFSAMPIKNNVYFKLSSVPSGTINVRVIGGKGYLNGQEISDGQRLTVEANKALQFKMVNPFDNSEKVTTVTVKPNETRDVILSPR